MRRLLMPVTVVTLTWAALAHAADWTALPTGTTADIHAISIFPGFEGYAAGDGGFFVQSSGGLANWTNVISLTTANLYSILEPAAGQVWVGGQGGTVFLKSGATWYSRGFSSAEDFVFFTLNSGGEDGLGTGGSIMQTQDFGLHWASQASGTTRALHAGSGYITGPAVVVGDGGTVLYTANGSSWTTVAIPTTEDLYAVSYDAISNIILVVGTHGAILRSVDGGATWSLLPSHTTATLRGLAKSGSVRLAVGDGGTILKSNDSGASWCGEFAGTTSTLYAAECLSAAEYFVVGAGGLILETTDGGGTCSTSTSVGEPAPAASYSVQLEGAMPLATGRSASLDIMVLATQRVRAEVFDVRGRSAALLFDGTIEGGASHSLALEAARFAPGVYILQVRGDDFRATRKIVVGNGR